MPSINVLSTQISNLIAAGEVVDRPASVAKELCENALDAGATAITLETKAGGTALLRITDNGHGMSEEDARRCVLRHATSKIQNAEDLNAIETLGFRGEALAAISAVSRFSILTKRPQDDFGHKLIFEGGELVLCEEAGCPDGTTILVEDLFYNQPARRKFLKRDATEQAALLQYMQRIAVAFPAVSFKCISEGSVKFQTPGDGKTLSAIRSIYGKEVSDTLFEIDYSLDGLSVSGFVSRPEHARPTRSLQCFYINQRYVKSKTMLFAMDDAFKSFLKSDRHPVAFLFLKTDYSDVDVNVHPAKLEVRFSDERAVYRVVYSAVRSAIHALTNPFSAPIKVEPEVIPPLPKNEQIRFNALEPRKPKEAHEARVCSPTIAPKPSYTWNNAPAKPAAMPLFDAALFSTNKTPSAKQGVENNVALHHIADLKNENTPDTIAHIDEPAQEVEENNPLRMEGGHYLGAVFHAYLLYELEDTLYVIDKHAAHERILYESLRAPDPINASQMLLAPIVIQLDAVEADAISCALEDLQTVGFSIESFGENTFALRAIPVEFSGLSETALREVLESFADEILRGGKATERRRSLWDRTLFTVACKAAMKAGRADTEEDCLWVIEKLKELKNIFVCPHGRPIISKFDQHGFERLFFRS